MTTPIQLNERIGSLDFIRGIALLGILAMNIQHFSYPFIGSFNPYVFGFDSATDSVVVFLTYTFFDQKMMGLFTILFGAGFYLFTDRLDQKQLGLKVTDVYTRRLMWLFIFGVIHAYFIWPGDILYHYAIVAFLLLPFRTWSVKNLMYVAAFLLVVQLSNSFYTRYYQRTEKFEKYQISMAVPVAERTARDSTNIKTWGKITKLKTKEDFKEEIELRGGNYFDNFRAGARFHKVQNGDLYWAPFLFQTLMMMIIGLIFIKTGILQDYKIWKHYWLICIFLIVLGLGLCATYSYYDTFLYSLPIHPLPVVWCYNLGPMVLSIGYLLLFNVLFQKFFVNINFRPLSTIGKMAFSNYIFQSIICVIIFFGYAFNRFDQYNRTELWIIVIAIWILQVILSMLWLKNRKYGPLEWAWRRLTYGKDI